MDVLLIRLEAPLMSFGAPVIDNFGVIQDFPALSLITGLLGNALGFEHREFDRLGALQARIRYAARRDRPGKRLQDYQTVALGQDHLLQERAWTTRGVLQARAGASSTSTHIRYRDYWADAAYTVALTLTPADAPPTLAEVERGLRRPQRPLFIGRKTCLPSSRLSLGLVEADDLLAALRAAPLAEGGPDSSRRHAWWPVAPDDDPGEAMKRPVTDARDWGNQIHVGERWIAHGDIDVEMPTEADHG